MNNESPLVRKAVIKQGEYEKREERMKELFKRPWW